jgi:hypothetical protein
MPSAFIIQYDEKIWRPQKSYVQEFYKFKKITLSTKWYSQILWQNTIKWNNPISFTMYITGRKVRPFNMHFRVLMFQKENIHIIINNFSTDFTRQKRTQTTCWMLVEKKPDQINAKLKHFPQISLRHQLTRLKLQVSVSGVFRLLLAGLVACWFSTERVDQRWVPLALICRRLFVNLPAHYHLYEGIHNVFMNQRLFTFWNQYLWRQEENKTYYCS